MLFLQGFSYKPAGISQSNPLAGPWELKKAMRKGGQIQVLRAHSEALPISTSTRFPWLRTRLTQSLTRQTERDNTHRGCSTICRTHTWQSKQPWPPSPAPLTLVIRRVIQDPSPHSCNSHSSFWRLQCWSAPQFPWKHDSLFTCSTQHGQHSCKMTIRLRINFQDQG